MGADGETSRDTTRDTTTGAATDAAVDDPFEAKNRLSGVGIVSNPHPRLAELRDACPAHRGSVSGLFGTIGPDNFIFPDSQQVTAFTYELAEAQFRNSKQLSNASYTPYLHDVLGRTILEMDPPEHHRYRSLIQGAFTKPEMERWEAEFAHDIIAGYLDRLAPAGRGDLAADFAFHYPIAVTAMAVGLGLEGVDAFYEQATLLTNVSVPEEQRKGAARELGEIIQGLIDERRAHPTRDLISVLTQARFRNAGERTDTMLTDNEIVAFVRLLVPAGAQTTYRALTNLLYGLLTHPDQLDALRADRSLIPQAIEEGLRWDGPIVSFARLTTEELELAGLEVPAGGVVNMCVHAANRDPSRWSEPDTFDIHREPQGHLSFGSGTHTCLGVHFARMELRLALDLILDRLPNLRLDPEADDVAITGLWQRTALHLPCVWDVPAA